MTPSHMSRVSSLSYGSFAKETYNNTPSHMSRVSSHASIHVTCYICKDGNHHRVLLPSEKSCIFHSAGLFFQILMTLFTIAFPMIFPVFFSCLFTRLCFTRALCLLLAPFFYPNRAFIVLLIEKENSVHDFCSFHDFRRTCVS